MSAPLLRVHAVVHIERPWNDDPERQGFSHRAFGVTWYWDPSTPLEIPRVELAPELLRAAAHLHEKDPELELKDGRLRLSDEERAAALWDTPLPVRPPEEPA